MKMMITGLSVDDGLLWFQIAYFVWQFVRVAKLFRLPYAVIVHTFMWIIGRWDRPFSENGYTRILPKRDQNFYLFPGTLETSPIDFKLEDIGDPKNDYSQLDDKQGRMKCLTIKFGGRKNLAYKFCSRHIYWSFVWNYLRDAPSCFAKADDFIFPGFAILDRVSMLEGLKMTCQGDYRPAFRRCRYLAIPDRELELNQNFIRFLSVLPIVAQAKGYRELSMWISLVVIGIDQFSLLFNQIWQSFKSFLFYEFKIFMITSNIKPQTRMHMCSFLSTISDKLMFSDQVALNFVRVRKGGMVYTLSPFNLADFEGLGTFEFKRQRKVPSGYTQEKFGIFRGTGGESVDVPDGKSILTHYVNGLRIDSIFDLDDDTPGTFFNFINNMHLHFGAWEGDDFENFQDLLQVVEEMQMLPIRQTEDGQLQSLDFNMLFHKGANLQKLTFLKTKKEEIIGGLLG